MMRSILHSLHCVILALGLAIAGFAQAQAGVAMTRAEAQTEVVICGDGGVHVVVLDATGRAVAKGKADVCRRCPVCAMAQVAVDPVSPEPMRPVTRERVADALIFNTPERAGPYGLPVARGPPARA